MAHIPKWNASAQLLEQLTENQPTKDTNSVVTQESPLWPGAQFCPTLLIWGWVFDLLHQWAERIQGRLVQAESKEPLVTEREAYRMAWLMVELLRRGEINPYLTAYIRMFGSSPEVIERKLQRFREFHLGAVAEQQPTLPPKKAPQRVLVAPVSNPKVAGGSQ